MNTQSRLIETAVLGAAIVTFGLAAGGKAKAETFENTIDSQPKTQLVAFKVKKLKKHHGHKSFKKAKTYKKQQKHHHGHHKSFGHKKTFHLFR